MLVLGAASAWGDAAYPARPIRLVVAASPGGGTDILARLVAQRLGERLGQPWLPDNRGGAGGSVAADLVAKAAPDGYTLLMTNDQLTVQASFVGRVSYDVRRDFVPVGLIGRTAIVLGVNPDVPARSVGELAALVRAHPGTYAFSSCGNGTPLHLAGELLNLSAHIDLAHVGYRGCAPALLDAVSGQVPIFFNMLGNAVPYARSGKLRLLAVASLQRLPDMPELPTIAEAGYTDFEAFPWYGILAPTGTPPQIVDRLNQALTEVVNAPDTVAKLHAVYFEPASATPEAFSRIIGQDLTRWSQVIRAASVKAD